MVLLNKLFTKRKKLSTILRDKGFDIPEKPLSTYFKTSLVAGAIFLGAITLTIKAPLPKIFNSLHIYTLKEIKNNSKELARKANYNPNTSTITAAKATEKDNNKKSKMSVHNSPTQTNNAYNELQLPEEDLTSNVKKTAHKSKKLETNTRKVTTITLDFKHVPKKVRTRTYYTSKYTCHYSASNRYKKYLLSTIHKITNKAYKAAMTRYQSQFAGDYTLLLVLSPNGYVKAVDLIKSYSYDSFGEKESFDEFERLFKKLAFHTKFLKAKGNCVKVKIPLSLRPTE